MYEPGDENPFGDLVWPQDQQQQQQQQSTNDGGGNSSRSQLLDTPTGGNDNSPVDPSNSGGQQAADWMQESSAPSTFTGHEPNSTENPFSAGDGEDVFVEGDDAWTFNQSRGVHHVQVLKVHHDYPDPPYYDIRRTDDGSETQTERLFSSQQLAIAAQRKAKGGGAAVAAQEAPDATSTAASPPPAAAAAVPPSDTWLNSETRGIEDPNVNDNPFAAVGANNSAAGNATSTSHYDILSSSQQQPEPAAPVAPWLNNSSQQQPPAPVMPPQPPLPVMNSTNSNKEDPFAFADTCLGYTSTYNVNPSAEPPPHPAAAPPAAVAPPAPWVNSTQPPPPSSMPMSPADPTAAAAAVNATQPPPPPVMNSGHDSNSNPFAFADSSTTSHNAAPSLEEPPEEAPAAAPWLDPTSSILANVSDKGVSPTEVSNPFEEIHHGSDSSRNAAAVDSTESFHSTPNRYASNSTTSSGGISPLDVSNPFETATATSTTSSAAGSTPPNTASDTSSSLYPNPFGNTNPSLAEQQQPTSPIMDTSTQGINGSTTSQDPNSYPNPFGSGGSQIAPEPPEPSQPTGSRAVLGEDDEEQQGNSGLYSNPFDMEAAAVAAAAAESDPTVQEALLLDASRNRSPLVEEEPSQPAPQPTYDNYIIGSQDNPFGFQEDDDFGEEDDFEEDVNNTNLDSNSNPFHTAPDSSSAYHDPLAGPAATNPNIIDGFHPGDYVGDEWSLGDDGSLPPGFAPDNGGPNDLDPDIGNAAAPSAFGRMSTATQSPYTQLPTELFDNQTQIPPGGETIVLYEEGLNPGDDAPAPRPSTATDKPPSRCPPCWKFIIAFGCFMVFAAAITAGVLLLLDHLSPKDSPTIAPTSAPQTILPPPIANVTNPPSVSPATNQTTTTVPPTSTGIFSSNATNSTTQSQLSNDTLPASISNSSASSLPSPQPTLPTTMPSTMVTTESPSLSSSVQATIRPTASNQSNSNIFVRETSAPTSNPSATAAEVNNVPTPLPATSAPTIYPTLINQNDATVLPSQVVQNEPTVSPTTQQTSPPTQSQTGGIEAGVTRTVAPTLVVETTAPTIGAVVLNDNITTTTAPSVLVAEESNSTTVNEGNLTSASNNVTINS